MSSATYKLYRHAIGEEKQVTCVYNGPYRELYPHIFGHKKGDEKVLAFQFGRSSSTKLPPGGQWRRHCLIDVTDVRLRGGSWHAGGSHSRQQRCAEDNDLDINVQVRPAREQRHAQESATTGVKLCIRKPPARKEGSGEATRQRGSRPGKATPKTSVRKPACKAR
jgi:hypothetical protein